MRRASREGVPGQAVVAPPVVRWMPGTLETLEVRASDRPGLLSEVASVIERNGGSIRWAAVTTLGGTVIDTFAVTWDSPLDDRRHKRISEQVRAACARA